MIQRENQLIKFSTEALTLRRDTKINHFRTPNYPWLANNTVATAADKPAY